MRDVFPTYPVITGVGKQKGFVFRLSLSVLELVKLRRQSSQPLMLNVELC